MSIKVTVSGLENIEQQMIELAKADLAKRARSDAAQRFREQYGREPAFVWFTPQGDGLSGQAGAGDEVPEGVTTALPWKG
jgi:hypothetical protein